MTRLVNLTLAALVGFAAVNGQYQKSNATYLLDMECANCIRSGNNFCLWQYAENTTTILNWNCTQDMNTYNYTKQPGGLALGYICSKAYKDEMNAIINGCRPWKNQNLEDDCGPYLVDLSDSNSFPIGRSVQNMKANSSCSYRAYSNCGYPEALFKVHDPRI